MRVTATLTIVAAAAFLAAGLASGRRASGRVQPSAPDAHNAVVASAVRGVLDSELAALASSLDELANAVGADDRVRAANAFRAARSGYKRAECLLASYAPLTVAALNGPAPDSDGDSPPPPLGAPAEFQQLEAALFHPGARGTRPGLQTMRTIAITMRNQVRDFRAQTPMVSVGDAELLESIRAEVARVSTLGLAGSDADEPREIARESVDALDGMAPLAATAAQLARNSAAISAWNAVAVAVRAAAAQLRADPEFERADRLTFVATRERAVTRALGDVRSALPPSRFTLRRAWRPEAASVFDTAAFDASAYAPEFAPASSPALIALGKKLFFDVRLSGPNTRSCASCHDPSRAFTDGRARALTLSAAAQSTARNTPTLLNAALEPALFADQRAGSLEEQVARVLSSPAEMHSSAELTAARLQADPADRAEFANAIPGHRDTAVTALGVRIALAAYMRTLVALNSRFDRAARGDTGALTASERRGFTLFMGKAHCGSCHIAPLFSGVAAPAFVSDEPEIIGIPHDPRVSRPVLDADPGREGVDHIAAHKFAFKVPTLRNVALTAPYMHNGAFVSLEQVVEFYDRGGGAGMGMHVPGQTLSAAPLHLSADDRHDLVAFLGTLTDTVTARIP